MRWGVSLDELAAVLQIRRGNRDYLGMNYPYFSRKYIFCDPSLEPSRGDGSNEGSKHMFFEK